jgi:hypothetical protein
MSQRLASNRPSIGSRGHFRVRWHTDRLLHVYACVLRPVLAAAAPLLSDVACAAAFFLLALSQRQVSRRGVFKGRHVTEVEGLTKRSTIVVLLVPQAKGVLVEGPSW